MSKIKIVDYKKFFRFIIIFLLALFILFKIPSFFSKNKEEILPEIQTSIQKTSTTIHMSVIGDIMCHSTNFKNAYNSTSKDYDFSNVFKNIDSYIKNADIAIGNLETTFSGKNRTYSGYPTFNTPEILGKNLKDLGIDVLSTANNHCMDKGYSGLESTLNFLDNFQISHTGTSRSKQEQNSILVKDVNGIKIAFLSFT